jgi:hypothetical protein
MFDTSLPADEDWDLWMRMSASGCKMRTVDGLVARYRRHGGNITGDPQRKRRASYAVLDKLFSDKDKAAQLADLREHAYLSQWLRNAQYCAEFGLTGERDRCLARAEELYQKAPHNPDLARRHLSFAASFAGTEHFAQTVGASLPEDAILYHWTKSATAFKAGRYREAAPGALRVLLRRPLWLAGRMFARFNRRQTRFA